MQSDQHINQIAPLDIDSCPSIIASQTNEIAFPPEPLLKFDKNDGAGWRRLIVVRSKYLPLPPRSQETGHQISAGELANFATRLTQEQGVDIGVDSVEFVLVS